MYRVARVCTSASMLTSWRSSRIISNVTHTNTGSKISNYRERSSISPTSPLCSHQHQNHHPHHHQVSQKGHILSSTLRHFSSFSSSSSPSLSSFSILANSNANLKSRGCPYTSQQKRGVVTFCLADIGEGIAEVELLKLYKKKGDFVEEMEAICEVQSDKAAVEITSRYSGAILHVHHNVGDMIKIGEPIVDIDVDGDEGSSPSSTPSSSTASSTASSAASSTASSDASSTTSSSSAPSSPSASSAAPVTAKRDSAILASPAVRRMAKEMNIDLALVTPTGRGDRITQDDIKNFMSSGHGSAAASTTATASTPTTAPSAHTAPHKTALPPTLPPRPPKENQEVILRGYSRAMVKSMVDSLQVPHLNIGDEYDVTKLLKLRQKMKKIFEDELHMKLTITPFLIKAVSLALKKYPILNSKIAPSLDKYTIYGSHNISMAIDSPNGLVVPNIKNVQDLTIAEIQAELLRLQHLAQTNAFKAEDLQGGTISISNVGVISGTYVKAILFDGQACIMGVGRLQKLPRFDEDGDVVEKDIMNFSFSADHRHCDGAVVARFNAEVKRYIEDPELMLLSTS